MAKCNAKRNASRPTLFSEKENRLKAAECICKSCTALVGNTGRRCNIHERALTGEAGRRQRPARARPKINLNLDVLCPLASLR
ncbi:hypothetical protein EVAR_17494_1 [Eumeta japonica]|uniref:Uncharacterized protein n=1 Tax=Eumeta variegata TaxID=151549 RepID=A0A4C1ZK94_EUMVA|nr:hypothetical protein EVAR_17494_1 [Eumeta japonica]